MTKPTGEPTALELAERALEKTDKDKYPKLYQAREQSVKALKAYEQQKDRAGLAEKKAKEKYGKESAIGEKAPKNKKESFDYGQLAYLEAKGIKSDEYPLVENWIEDTGRELKDVVENTRFQAELKDLRNEKASADAIPEGNKRSGRGVIKNKVDYWLAKGEMPPADQPELRREYVNAKMKRETDKSKFTDNPVIQ